MNDEREKENANEKWKDVSVGSRGRHAKEEVIPKEWITEKVWEKQEVWKNSYRRRESWIYKKLIYALRTETNK